MEKIKHRYKNDIIDIMKSLLDEGYEITSDEVIKGIEEFSVIMSAGWCVPDYTYFL